MIEIEKIKKEYTVLQEEFSKPGFFLNKEYKEMARRFKELEELIEIFEKKERLEKETKEALEVLKKEKDSSLKKLAEEELQKLSLEKKTLNEEMKKILEKKKEGKEKFLVEIRAGAGGEEASLWAGELFSMYQKFTQKKGFKMKILESHPTSLRGFKKIFFEIQGEKIGELLKYESGVHRVQRTPRTEKSGRIHTSTATVAVLEIPEKGDLEIRPQDLKIESFRSSGPGGQYVNKRESAVRITHLPTEIVVSSQTARTQFQNRENALAILRAMLYQRRQKEEGAKLEKERKEQIKKGMRPEKIRTYNFPQSRVTDHRISKSWKNLNEILEGRLEPMIEELKKEEGL